ncbi:MAG TPA: cytochrome c oxidase subunit 3, partial [Kofleriaceae bacterium]
GAINTGVLIFSSLTAAWAVRAAQLAQRKLLIGCLAVTIVCACAFLGIKYIEYSHKIHEHILFGRYFDPCISPGGEELLTKRNECMGTTGSVVWDFKANDTGGKATEGCFDVDKLDLDLKLEGVQADCQVEVVKYDEKGKDVGPGQKITNQCPDELLEILNNNKGESNAEGAGKIAAPKYPCWRPAYQPGVCPDATTAEDHLHSKPARPQTGILVEWGDHEERPEMKAKAVCKAPAAAQPMDALKLANETHKSTEIGQRAIHPIHEPSVHEEHEIESLGPPPDHTNMFFTIYFAMTGLHGIHVLVGIMIFIWLLIRSIKGHFTPDYFGPIDFSALYWHIVDLIWIFLFPLLYLIH